MKKIDKIAGAILLILSIYTVFYLIQTKLIFTADRGSLYIVISIIVVSILYLIFSYLILGIILSKRIKYFSEISKRYSLNHVFTKKILFIPYGGVNTLSGNINGHAVVIADELSKPNVIDVFISITTRGFSKNIGTKIYVDNINKTPNYSRNNIIHIDPFMSVSEVETYLKSISE